MELSIKVKTDQAGHLFLIITTVHFGPMQRSCLEQFDKKYQLIISKVVEASQISPPLAKLVASYVFAPETKVRARIVCPGGRVHGSYDAVFPHPYIRRKHRLAMTGDPIPLHISITSASASASTATSKSYTLGCTRRKMGRCTNMHLPYYTNNIQYMYIYPKAVPHYIHIDTRYGFSINVFSFHILHCL